MFFASILILSLAAAPLALAQEYASTTTFEFSGSTLPTGLSASNYKVGKKPNQHEYISNNVEVSGGFLNLKVNGGQSTDSAICSGEVVTDFTISSARVETYAILAEVPGVVNGKPASLHPSIPSSSPPTNTSPRNLPLRVRHPRDRHRVAELSLVPIKHRRRLPKQRCPLVHEPSSRAPNAEHARDQLTTLRRLLQRPQLSHRLEQQLEHFLRGRRV
jgi:hypothetical protein